MNKEIPGGTDPRMFAAVFNENWQNARHIKSERISYINAFSLISAGVLPFLKGVRGSAVLQAFHRELNSFHVISND